MIYAAFILLIAAVLYCHSRDWKENKATGRVQHSKAWRWKVLLSIPAGICFVIYLIGWPVMWNRFAGVAFGKSAIFTAIWFLFLFNAVWGWRANKDIFYRSTAVGANISKWDKMVLHWPKWLYILFMVVLIGAATILYFYAYR